MWSSNNLRKIAEMKVDNKIFIKTLNYLAMTNT